MEEDKEGRRNSTTQIESIDNNARSKSGDAQDSSGSVGTGAKSASEFILKPGQFHFQTFLDLKSTSAIQPGSLKEPDVRRISKPAEIISTPAEKYSEDVALIGALRRKAYKAEAEAQKLKESAEQA